MRALLRQLIALGLVEVDYENFSSLKLTEASRAVPARRNESTTTSIQKAEKALKHKRQSAKDFAETQLDDLNKNL